MWNRKGFRVWFKPIRFVNHSLCNPKEFGVSFKTPVWNPKGFGVRHNRTGPPADGLQAAARRVRLERPARDRRARLDRGPLPKLQAWACELCRDPDSRIRIRRARARRARTRRARTREPRPVRPFRVFFRVQAERVREAFILNGNSLYPIYVNNNDVSQSNGTNLSWTTLQKHEQTKYFQIDGRIKRPVDPRFIRGLSAV